jgi:hypothetical protein
VWIIDNCLCGPIPLSFGNLSKLKHLSMDGLGDIGLNECRPVFRLSCVPMPPQDFSSSRTSLPTLLLAQVDGTPTTTTPSVAKASSSPVPLLQQDVSPFSSSPTLLLERNEGSPPNATPSVAQSSSSPTPLPLRDVFHEVPKTVTNRVLTHSFTSTFSRMPQHPIHLCPIHAAAPSLRVVCPTATPLRVHVPAPRLRVEIPETTAGITTATTFYFSLLSYKQHNSTQPTMLHVEPPKPRHHTTAQSVAPARP